MSFAEACAVLLELLRKSAGHPIELSSGKVRSFNGGKTYSVSEFSAFERKWNITLPGDYKVFMGCVGACQIYVNKFGLGLDFYGLEDLESHSSEVFYGMSNPFPRYLPIAANRSSGDSLGFDLSREGDAESFGCFSSEEDPEKWLVENVHRTEFSRWLIGLVSTNGEKVSA